MSNAERIYNIAERQVQALVVCIDRLQRIDGIEELIRLSGHLQVLAARALPFDHSH
jgi:hypothetical protein